MKTVLVYIAGITFTIFGMNAQMHAVTVIGLFYICAASYWIVKNEIG